MLRPDLYIHSAGFIAPEAAPDEPAARLSAREPDYAGIIPPMQLRRMSKAVRMGIGAAKACLDGAGMQRSDAIAVGTAMGCLQDTEVFLQKLVTQEERMLTPTAFIQSTHNTVAGQIALVTGCHGYNTTISQRGHSFEGAVMSAALYLAEHPEHSVLCGGVDELTDTSFTLMQRAGVYTREPYAPDDLFHAAHAGAIAGEGAGFLLLNKKAEGAKARIARLHLFTERNIAAALKEVDECMALSEGHILPDALWLGVSGDVRQDELYQALLKEWSGDVALFKQRTGEWGTAIATALSHVVEWPQGIERIWIVNHYCDDWSMWLLERGA
jgi:3-oxoacyl-[acyl-carrier-protein] synthase II